MKRNLTDSIRSELLKRARACASNRRKTLALLKQGLHLGGQGIANREALHDRVRLR